MVFVAGFAVDLPFHEWLSLNIPHADAVQYHVNVDISALVVPFIMRTDQNLVPREISDRKFHPQFLRPFECQPALCAVLRIKAQDVVVGFDLSPGTVLVILCI